MLTKVSRKPDRANDFMCGRQVADDVIGGTRPVIPHQDDLGDPILVAVWTDAILRVRKKLVDNRVQGGSPGVHRDHHTDVVHPAAAKLDVF